MLSRQKILILLICALNEKKRKITRRLLDKMLFLLKMEYEIDRYVKFYNFYPHKYGPFSNNFYADLAVLESSGLISTDYRIDENAKKQLQKLSAEVYEMIENIVNKEFDEKTVVDYVYEKYPEYTTRSRLIKHENAKVIPAIFSIGYEQKDIDSFLNLLIQNNVQIVVDVRRNPFSMNFAFTRTKLQRSLNGVGIEYIHYPNLGIEGELRKNLNEEKDYKKLFELYSKEMLPKNTKDIAKVLELGKKGRIVLLCFEKDPQFCHRGILSKKLEDLQKIQVKHL
jgi:uncharacterized protein (DUF488 family)